METQKSELQVNFSPNVPIMDFWTKRINIPLSPHAKDMDNIYARAHPWLQSLSRQLVNEHQLKLENPSSNRILFSVRVPQNWMKKTASEASPITGRVRVLELPLQFSSFFSPDRGNQWQMVFHSDMFRVLRKLCPPVEDMFRILQCLAPGMFTIVLVSKDEKGVLWRTTNALPDLGWISQNKDRLVSVFGAKRIDRLTKAVSDATKGLRWAVELEPRQKTRY